MLPVKHFFGDIEFDVPNSWTVREVDDAVEIADASGSWAMHLSVLNRARTEPVSELDAQVLIENFASNNDLTPEGPATFNLRTDEARAIGQFRALQPDGETPLHWLVACVVWPGKAIRASYCADSVDAEKIELAKAVFEAIGVRGE